MQDYRVRRDQSTILGVICTLGPLCPMASALNSISCVYLCVRACVCVCMCTRVCMYELPEHMEHNKVFLANPRAFFFF